MATEQKDIQRVDDTLANLLLNLIDGQLGFQTDGDGDMVHRSKDGLSYDTFTPDGGNPDYVTVVATSDSDTLIDFSTADKISFDAGGIELLALIEDTQDEVVINDAGVDVDFRVETSAGANSFFVQGSSGDVGINTVPDHPFHIVTNTNDGVVAKFVNTNNGTAALSELKFYSNDAINYFSVGKAADAHTALAGAGFIWNVDTTPIIIATSNTERVRVSATGDVGVGTDPGNKFDIVTGATTNSAVHIGEAIDEGGYLTSTTDNNFNISSGAELVSGSWIARATSANIIEMSAGVIEYYVNTSLTDGNSFAPTTRALLTTIAFETNVQLNMNSTQVETSATSFTTTVEGKTDVVWEPSSAPSAGQVMTIPDGDDGQLLFIHNNNSQNSEAIEIACTGSLNGIVVYINEMYLVKWLRSEWVAVKGY